MTSFTRMREEYDRLVASGVSQSAARARVSGRGRRGISAPTVANVIPPTQPRSAFAPHVPVPREYEWEGPQRYRADIVERLDGLFTRGPRGWPGRNAPNDYSFLAQGLEHGLVRMRIVRIPAAVVAKAAQADGYASCASESAGHLFLKAVAVEWLRSMGGDDAEEEVRIHGRMDAYSQKLNWCVEVGHTRVSKIRQLMKDQDGSRFTLIPFQRRIGAMRGKVSQSYLAIDFDWDAAIERVLVDHDMAAMRRAMEAVNFAPTAGASHV